MTFPYFVGCIPPPMHFPTYAADSSADVQEFEKALQEQLALDQSNTPDIEELRPWPNGCAGHAARGVHKADRKDMIAKNSKTL